MNFKTYLVGGAVRDELLGIPCKDLDYVVLAPSFDALRQALLDSGCKIFVEKPEFLTFRAKHPTLGTTDFACARKEGEYTDGRHPDAVEVATTIEEDLARRDFACNSIAKDVITGELVDPYGGIKDTKDKMLRCVGNPLIRFSEDRLRVFRAVRFAVQKRFIIEHNTSMAMHEFAYPDFAPVSTERIRDELHKMFVKDAAFSFHLLQKVYPNLWTVVEQRGIWFKPTTEAK
jgi:tRNA nucleotidyltransferase/poly(A) polymerase